MSEISNAYIGLHIMYRYSCQKLLKLELSQQIFETYSNINFHEYLSSCSSVVPSGQTDGQKDRQRDKHYEANSRFSQFCERS